MTKKNRLKKSWRRKVNFEACYDLAITQLKDKDRPFWIRPYYNIGE